MNQIFSFNKKLYPKIIWQLNFLIDTVFQFKYHATNNLEIAKLFLFLDNPNSFHFYTIPVQKKYLHKPDKYSCIESTLS